MRVFLILLCIGILCTGAQASNNVEIHFNYPADTIFIGAVNTMEIWIENDIEIEALSLALLMTGDNNQFIWNTSYGSDGVLAVNDALSGFGSAHLNPMFQYDQYLPDSIIMSATSFGSTYPGLAPNSMRACFMLEFTVPSSESPGQIGVDNILGLNAAEWLFSDGVSETTPDYAGCVNLNSYNPDCGALTFPLEFPAIPDAYFTFTPDEGDYPLEVTFTDYTTNNPTQWYWLFGDGGTSSEQNPVHTYNFAGVFFPILIVGNVSGTDTLVSPVPLTVTEPDVPIGLVMTCPEVKNTSAGITDEITFTISNNTDNADDFTFTANDSLGWFLSPTFNQFHLESYATKYITVEILIPEETSYGDQDKLSGSVVSQTNPDLNAGAVCRLMVGDRLCGDVNLDGKVNISDAVIIINYVFNNGPAPCETGK